MAATVTEGSVASIVGAGRRTTTIATAAVTARTATALAAATVTTQ